MEWWVERSVRKRRTVCVRQCSPARLLSPSPSSSAAGRASSSSSSDHALDASESESQSSLRLGDLVLDVESFEHRSVLEHVGQDQQANLAAANVHEVELRDLAVATGKGLGVGESSDDERRRRRRGRDSGGGGAADNQRAAQRAAARSCGSRQQRWDGERMSRERSKSSSSSSDSVRTAAQCSGSQWIGGSNE